MLKNQTRQKLRGEQHIEDRLVSLDELDARPIKKGKAFPKCEFGTTNQISFNGYLPKVGQKMVGWACPSLAIGDLVGKPTLLINH